MKFRSRRHWYSGLWAWSVCGWLTFVSQAFAASVLMVSVDGMKPEYVTQADLHGLKAPFLRSLMAEGSFATGVEGVWPTLTYPSHTTLLTGVAPAEHGIYNNLEFDPRHQFAESWFWYAHQIRVPTLWQAAHHAGMVTASVGWPASVGATDVDFLIPEYWRIFHPTQDLNPSDRHLIADLSRPEGLLRRMEESLGPYMMGNDTSLEGDETKTQFALDILMRYKPGFMTIHLSSLDSEEHEHGPFSAEAVQDLEVIDGMLARLAAAARANDPAAIVLVVSDHGFTALTHRVDLTVAFIQAGLIEVTTDPSTHARTIKSWIAEPWFAGGMAAVVLRDPIDQSTERRVRKLLLRVAADPLNGIAAVLDRAAMDRRGAFPGAAFLVVMRDGFYVGTNPGGELLNELRGHGGHGFAPHDPAMRAALFTAGLGVARHRNLGIVDMRQIAPTVARWLQVPLSTATAPPLATSDPMRARQ